MFKRFDTRLFFSDLLVLLFFLLFLFLLFYPRLHSFTQGMLAQRLQQQGRVLEPALRPLLQEGGRERRAELREFALRAASAGGEEVAVLADDGRVLADSETTSAEGSGAADSDGGPELDQARERGWGQAVRRDAAGGRDLLYVALPLREGGVTSFLRLGLPLDQAGDMEAVFTRQIGWALAGALLAALLLSAVLARAQGATISRISQAAGMLATRTVPEDSAPPGATEEGQLETAILALGKGLKQSFSRLESERSLLNATLQGMAEGVLVLDRAGRLLLANPTAERIFGFALQGALGKPFYEFKRNSDLAKLVDEAQEKPGQLVSGEMNTPEAEEQVFSVHATQLKDGPEGPERTLVVFSDITEVKRLMRMRSEFVANVSHELKTPLTAIRASLETLMDGALEDSQVNRDFLGKALRQTERLTQLIEDLLVLSSIEEQQRAGTPAAHGRGSLEAAFAAALASVESKASGRGVAIRLESAGGLPETAMEESSLIQVFTNLLDNAVKYSPAQGQIRVTLAESEGRALVTVADQGPGIAPEQLPRLFERFYRVDKARSREMGGTGLGLSIVKHLVEGVGGGVGVRSEVGKGSAFWFRVPFAPRE